MTWGGVFAPPPPPITATLTGPIGPFVIMCNTYSAPKAGRMALRGITGQV